MAHALQFGALYLYDASYDNDSKSKQLPDNIRCFFQFLSAYFWDIRIKEPSSGTGAPVVKRINPKVKVSIFLEQFIGFENNTKYFL